MDYPIIDNYMVDFCKEEVKSRNDYFYFDEIHDEENRYEEKKR